MKFYSYKKRAEKVLDMLKRGRKKLLGTFYTVALTILKGGGAQKVCTL